MVSAVVYMGVLRCISGAGMGACGGWELVVYMGEGGVGLGALAG